MIYFDESGNSGTNLLDKEQPIFLLFSHDYTLEQATEILRPLLEVSKAIELHFKNLKKWPKSQKALLECLNHEMINESSIYHYFAHKEFMVVIQIVDQLIETVLYSNGIDIYKGGRNISMANLIYIMGKNVWDRDLFEKMCRDFVAWFRSNDIQKSEVFYDTVAQLAATLSNEEEKMLIRLIAMSRLERSVIQDSWTKYTLDATLSCFIDHCQFWAKKYGKPFDIVFDNSKQIDYWTDMIKFMTDSLPTQEVGYGSRKHKYPLLINNLSLQDSAQSIPIQLADVLGSALNYARTSKLKGNFDPFAEEILSSRLGKCRFNLMWPSTEMTPEELDMEDESGTNPLDFLAANLYNRDRKKD